jgi:hypothetical protein
MSVQATSWAWKAAHGLDPTCKLVLLWLADCANQNGEWAFPSVATLASQAEISERSVKRHLQTLRDRGLITVQAEASWHQDSVNGAKYRRPTAYRLAILGVPSMSPQGSDDEVTPVAPQTGDGVSSGVEWGATSRNRSSNRTHKEPKSSPAADAAEGQGALLGDEPVKLQRPNQGLAQTIAERVWAHRLTKPSGGGERAYLVFRQRIEEQLDGGHPAADVESVAREVGLLTQAAWDFGMVKLARGRSGSRPPLADIAADALAEIQAARAARDGTAPPDGFIDVESRPA